MTSLHIVQPLIAELDVLGTERRITNCASVRRHPRWVLGSQAGRKRRDWQLEQSGETGSASLDPRHAKLASQNSVSGVVTSRIASSGPRVDSVAAMYVSCL